MCVGGGGGGGGGGNIGILCFCLVTAHELCEIRGGRPGLPVPNSLYGLCGRKATMNVNFCLE